MPPWYTLHSIYFVITYFNYDEWIGFMCTVVMYYILIYVNLNVLQRHNGYTVSHRIDVFVWFEFVFFCLNVDGACLFILHYRSSSKSFSRSNANIIDENSSIVLNSCCLPKYTLRLTEFRFVHTFVFCVVYFRSFESQCAVCTAKLGQKALKIHFMHKWQKHFIYTTEYSNTWSCRTTAIKIEKCDKCNCKCERQVQLIFIDKMCISIKCTKWAKIKFINWTHMQMQILNTHTHSSTFCRVHTSTCIYFVKSFWYRENFDECTHEMQPTDKLRLLCVDCEVIFIH